MNPMEEKINKVLESKTLLTVLKIAGIIILALIIFSTGVAVGFHKASFNRLWGEHYYENFAPTRNSFQAWDLDDLPNAHGAIGKIIKKELPTLIVQDKDNTEKVILLKEDTKIEKIDEEISALGLNIDDFVVVVGSPNTSGQIEAKLIRVIPSPGI